MREFSEPDSYFYVLSTHLQPQKIFICKIVYWRKISWW